MSSVPYGRFTIYDGNPTGAAGLAINENFKTTEDDLATLEGSSHTQGSDTILDAGGTNEVTAEEALAAYDHSLVNTGNPHAVTKTDVGLSNVTNDAQVKKAVSSTNDTLPKWSGTTGDALVDSSVSEADVATAVSSSHTQNTDTGTTSGSFQVNSGDQKSGPGTASFQCGRDNTQSGRDNTQSGYNNTQSGDRSTQSGYTNTQSGLYSTQSGYVNVQRGDYGLQFGQHASDEYSANNAWPTAFTHGGGYFAVAGDAQNMRFVVRKQVIHNNDDWTTLQIKDPWGDEYALILPADSCWTFTAKVVGATQDIGKAFSYTIEGCIERIGSSTTRHTAIVTTIHEDDADFGCQVVAEGALAIQVRDATSGGDTVRWVASVDVVQVKYT